MTEDGANPRDLQVLRGLFDSVERAVEDVARRRTELDQEERDLLAEREGLWLSVRRLSGGEPAGIERPEPEPSRAPRAKGITAAVVDVLQSTDRLLSPRDFMELLQARGLEPDNVEQVRSALSYLSRTRRAGSHGRGAWYLIGGSQDPAVNGDEIFGDLIEDEARPRPDHHEDRAVAGASNETATTTT